MYECLRLINSNVGSPTYSLTSFTKDEILENHKSVLLSFGINIKEDEENLPSLYWIPKLHKTPYKERYIAGSSRCSTKHLSKVLTSILSTVKDGLQKYCDKIYSTSGVNQMFIIKILKSYFIILICERCDPVNLFPFKMNTETQTIQ